MTSRQRWAPKSKDYTESIDSAGGMGGGSNTSDGKTSRSAATTGKRKEVDEAVGAGMGGEPAAFFAFNGANGPMSGVWAPNTCDGDERVGQQPAEGGVEFELTYMNGHTQEYDESCP